MPPRLGHWYRGEPPPPKGRGLGHLSLHLELLGRGLQHHDRAAPFGFGQGFFQLGNPFHPVFCGLDFIDFGIGEQNPTLATKRHLGILLVVQALGLDGHPIAHMGVQLHIGDPPVCIGVRSHRVHSIGNR